MPYSLHIPAGKRVLEIGSGNNPNPRSDVLCDRYVFDNHERAGEFRIVIDRPMIIADGFRLPFPDQSFDFVICSHTLEHIKDPIGFAHELARVAPSGYIEVPSALSERMFGWNFHHWYCVLERTSLILYPKTEGERFGGFFHRLIATQIWFRRFFEEHEEAMYVRYHWKGKPRIVRKPFSTLLLSKWDENMDRLLSSITRDAVADMLFYCTWMYRRIRRKFSKLFKLAAWRLTVAVRPHALLEFYASFLVCVRCKQSVLFSPNVYTCTSCTATYPVSGVMPIMLLPHERKKGF